jgi:multicomponent Na+:H+ antiporter subunit E
MNIKTKSRITVFLLSLLCWFGLTDIKNIQEVIVGLVVSLIVSFSAGHMLITTQKSQNIVKRIFGFIIYLFKFIWELIKANVHVAYIVLHPKIPIKPGLVKIKTSLKKDTSLTILANSITLTPGTLTVDVNKSRGDLYVHWIDTKTTDTNEASEHIGGRFEKSLKEVFE